MSDEHNKPTLEYAKPSPPRSLNPVIGAPAGVFGYLGLVVPSALIFPVFMNYVDYIDQKLVVIVLVTPLLIISGTSFAFRSLSMFIAALVTASLALVAGFIWYYA